ncbi:MAG: type II secretion system protein GspM [Gemmatimonadota bacterium]
MTPRFESLERLRDRVRALSTRDRRALLLGLLILGPALGWIGIVRPWQSALASLAETAGAEESLLQRERALLREAPTLPGRLSEARATLARKEARLVQSVNPALAEAEVVGLVEELARANRALFLEARSVALGVGEEPPPGLIPIRLNVRVESDFEGILDFLHAIESDPLLIRVVGLSMQAGESGVMNFMAVIEAYASREEVT